MPRSWTFRHIACQHHHNSYSQVYTHDIFQTSELSRCWINVVNKHRRAYKRTASTLPNIHQHQYNVHYECIGYACSLFGVKYGGTVGTYKITKFITCVWWKRHPFSSTCWSSSISRMASHIAASKSRTTRRTARGVGSSWMMLLITAM